MKTLLLMRHAKSSWDEGDVTDHDRPLNLRGERAAPQMARVLAEAGVEPDLVISSTALRARTTALAVAEMFEWRPEVRLQKALYMASTDRILAVVATAPPKVETLLVVGHNPGMEDLVSDLAFMRQAMPTAAIASFSFDAASWTELSGGHGRLVHVWRPKELD